MEAKPQAKLVYTEGNDQSSKYIHIILLSHTRTIDSLNAYLGRLRKLFSCDYEIKNSIFL